MIEKQIKIRNILMYMLSNVIIKLFKESKAQWFALANLLIFFPF